MKTGKKIRSVSSKTKKFFLMQQRNQQKRLRSENNCIEIWVRHGKKNIFNM